MNDHELATALVQQAGRLAAQMRLAGVEAEQKSHVSDVVTAADKAAEKAVVERLAAERPDDGVLGEEGASRPGTTGRRWVIDPVDGTYNFLRGLDWWCSALALVDGEELVLGAVYHPASDTTFLGGPRLPSTRNGQPLAPLVDVPVGQACASTYLHPPFYDDAAVGEVFNRAVSQVATVRMLGSGTMDAMAIAEGTMDVLFQHSVPDWDRLPGAAIIRGCGGVSEVVAAGGKQWHVAGGARAATAVAAALTSVPSSVTSVATD